MPCSFNSGSFRLCLAILFLRSSITFSSCHIWLQRSKRISSKPHVWSPFSLVSYCYTLLQSHSSVDESLPLFHSLGQTGLQVLRIFNSSDKGFTSPLLPASSDRFTYDSTYTCLSFLHFLFAQFFGLAINSSEFLLRQYNVDSIFCFLSLLSLPDFVYTDSLLPVRSRIPQHLFACLLVTFFDLSSLVLSTKGSSS